MACSSSLVIVLVVLNYTMPIINDHFSNISPRVINEIPVNEKRSVESGLMNAADLN